MSNIIENYPNFFRSLKPGAVRLYGKSVKKDVWQKVYLHIGHELFFISVTPLIDDRDFDYVFCLELIHVKGKTVDELPVEKLARHEDSVITPEYFALSERLSSDACRSIKRLNISDERQSIVIAPSYEEYFSCHIWFSKNTNRPRSVP